MRKTIVILLLLALALTGCATEPPEETAAPTREAVETIPEAVVTASAPQPPQMDLEQMKEDLDILSAVPRPIGSEGEQAAATYLKERLETMGYTVTIQPYLDSQNRRGSNVVAVKAAAENADILVISAHHDSAPTSPGANDNASGAAALLAVAEKLKDLDTDTELRFISFTDEENGKKGSRYYTEALTQEELGRMIGCIQLDMLGGLGTEGARACTMDGQENWLSDLLRSKDSRLGLAAETGSDHASFQLAGVPSVLLTQEGRGYLYHSAADRADQLDVEAIARAAAAAADTVKEIAGSETASYRELARQQGRNYIYCQTRQNVIYFESSLYDTESHIGAAGEHVSHEEESGNGWTDSYDTYRYSMRWFNGKTPMNTYYRYRNGFLQNIEIRPFETDYTIDQVKSLITAMYGQPTAVGTDREGRSYEAWQDEIYSKHLTLTDDPQGFTVTVSKYSVGISRTLSGYEVTGGQADINDAEDAAVWRLLCQILPKEHRQKIRKFQLFTDGASNILAYTYPVRNGDVSDNSRFVMTLDYYDVYDEKGDPRDQSKLIYTIVHEYGHVLLEDETQVDLTVGENTHDPAGFIEGSLRKAYYDRFWARLGTGAGDYDAHPSHYVSRYGANLFHEDIADTFAIFVLGAKPAGDTVAEEKLLFFWDYPELVELRSAIRGNLGLAA